MLCMSGCRMPPYISFMFLVGSIPLISLQRKCRMALVFNAYKIPSCVLCLTFSAVSLGCTSLAPACRAPTTEGFAVRGFFVGIYQQGFVSFGVILLSIVSDLGSHLTSLQCQLSYHPFTSSSCTIHADTSEVEPKTLFMGHEISSFHVPVVSSFIVLFKTWVSS